MLGLPLVKFIVCFILNHEVAIIYEKQRQSGRSRLVGFQQALSEADILLEHDTRCMVSEAKEAAKKLFSLPKKPTAIFAVTDLIAIVLINEARSADIKVPGDLSVIGFDNTIYAKIADSRLTTIEQPIIEMVNYSFDQLLHPLELLTRILLEPTLIERGSVQKNINK
ncbi:substrate-binding domain-containing protein [Domibacillus sp. A3M-37]|uniref:substrate-binding domain-containing protein n=1 Tax=Domibacillus sp. A3M-37 TaxID=2962037 RepID=UPI0020B80B02|nr:substrate-binding domain-containing protein [Domibacillus sp. A3M-37]MCP3764376.1 substrate-binding domain-containing protein [Domibacillus sp. A3M-37]